MDAPSQDSSRHRTPRHPQNHRTHPAACASAMEEVFLIQMWPVSSPGAGLVVRNWLRPGEEGPL